jgi:hypothetical protein
MAVVAGDDPAAHIGSPRGNSTPTTGVVPP